MQKFYFSFLIHLSSTWICVMSCPSFHPPVFCDKDFNIGCYLQILEPSPFIPTMLIGTNDFHHFSLAVDVGLGSQGQHKAKPVCFIFSHTFQLIRMKYGVRLKQFRLIMLLLQWMRRRKKRLLVNWEWDLLDPGKITDDLLTAWKKPQHYQFIGEIHLYVYELICFKLGVGMPHIQMLMNKFASNMLW